MDVSQAVALRTSVRAFKAETPPQALVQEILEAAARAPSGAIFSPGGFTAWRARRWTI